MQTPLLRRFCATIAALSLFSLSVAQSASTGSIEGRVQNIAKGDYLNNARVTVENSNLATLTNEFGEYRLSDVPVGEAKVTVFYSGLPSMTESVAVAAGQAAIKNFDLKPASDVVQLAAYSVSASREMSPAAIATNEQRFAPNMKTVLSAEEFGEQSENNVAEFLKLMPAVQISYVDQDARNASLRGMPTYTTIVTANGNQIASASSSNAIRNFEFEQISMNDIARVEVNKTLVPDMPAEGIGGTINLITKSAFERARPDFKFRTYVNFNTTAIDFKETPGPFRDPSYKLKPGFDFTYTNPITKTFGITLSGSYSSKFNPQWYADPTWNLNLDKTTGIENPYVTSFNYYDGPKTTDRIGGRIAFDWRFAPRDTLTIGFSEQFYRALLGLRRMNSSIGSGPTDITSKYVQGKAVSGTVGMSASQNDKSGTTWTPEFKYMHNGPVWKIESGGAYSRAGNDYYAADKGFFSGANFTLATISPTGTGLVSPTLRYDYGNYIPNITAVMSDGRVVDPHDVREMALTSATALRRKSMDLKKTLRLNATRMVDLWVPVKIKAGGDIRQSIRDIREVTPSYTFVGPDGKANTADNLVKNYDLVDESFSSVTPRFGRTPFHWYDVYKVYDLYVKHPDWWQTDPAALHNNLVDKSKFLTETISSGFIRFDTGFFRNRLQFTGGVRYQNYKVKTESGEVNNLGKYLTDTEGELIIDPVTNKPITLPGDPTQVAELTNIERGVKRTSTEKGYYPSINTTFRITENLQIRAGYADSINYPDLGDILAVTTVSDYTATTRQVIVNHPLKPWTAHNYDAEIEYFTPAGGSISASWWRKEMSGFVTSATYRGTDAKAVLERNGYGMLYPLGYEVRENFNAGLTFLQGWEFALNQNLDRFVPTWGRGFNVFFNTSYKGAPHASGASGIDAVSTRSINWGASYRRGRLSTTLKFNFVQEPKRLYPSTTSTRSMSRTYTDADVSFRLTRSLSVFASGTNIFGVPVETFVYDPATPDYARRRAHHFYGVQCVAGIKGQF